MNLIKKGLLLASIALMAACENEVEINADFVEKTAVFGLLDVNADTQFIKINKTFLDDNTSSLELAKDPSRLFYDTTQLSVVLIEKLTNKNITLKPILKPKESGIFTNEVNIVYFSTEKLLSNETYDLVITKPDGSQTKGSAKTVDGIRINKPRPDLDFSFIKKNNINPIVDDYQFELNTGLNGNNIAEIELRFNFYFKEIVSGIDSVQKVVSFPLRRLFNNNLQSNEVLTFKFDGQRFFNELEKQVPPSINPTKKVISRKNSVEIEIYAADETYGFYRELNGPIDGLAQTRPEFTNIENGIGLFSSRYSGISTASFNEEMRNYLIETYRSNRNFVTGN